jgi:hypothetical protein
MEAVDTPDGSTALGYYHRGNMLARGVVSNDALEAIEGLLETPVSLALAATEDEQGNIDARICLVLPVDAEEQKRQSEDEPDEPWRASVPEPPQIGESQSWNENGTSEDAQPKLALLPIGNAVRGARDRHHNDVASDVREMLENLLNGRGRDAVSKAIDDLLGSL